MAVYFELLASNTMKNETGKQVKQMFTENKFSKVFIRIPGTSTSVQNDCIKLSCYGVDINRLFLHHKITRKCSCREKLFDPENFFTGF